MRTIPCIIAGALIAFCVLPAGADEKIWIELQDRAIDLYQAKQYDEAVATATKALAEAEATFGPEHNNVAESLDNLAIYEQALGRNDIAEDHYLRALAILEKNLPPDDHYLAIFMNYVADFYQKIGKPERAAELRARAKAIRAKGKK